MTSYSEVKEKFNLREAINFVKEDNPVFSLTSHEGEAVIRISKDGREKITFYDLKIKAFKLGLYLKEIQGVKKGDVISVLASKKIEQIIVLLATLSIGAIYQPLFTAFGPKAIEMRINDIKPKVIFCQDDQKEKISCTPFSKLDDMLSYGELKEPNKTSWDDPIILLYTSGTTGLPKGALISKRLLLNTYVYMKYGIGLRERDVFWNPADPGWAYGLYYGIIGPLLFRKTVIFLDEPFQPDRTMEFMEENKITNFAFAPTAYRMIAGTVKKKYDLVLERASSAGEPLNPEVIRWFKDNYNVMIKDHYGQTEVGMVVYNGWGYDAEVKIGSMGLPAPGYDVDVIDDIIAVKRTSPGFHFLGYINNPEKTKDSFRGDWYLTGDNAYKDSDGYFWFVGRKDDVVKISGYRVGPFEVESVLLEFPAVLESAVVADEDPVRGHILHAYVVLKPGYEPNEKLKDEIMKYVSTKYSKHVHLEKVDFVDKLPKTESGKIQRYLLRRKITEEKR
ncbi:AMP-dependent synthetase [Sulfolobus sp. A20]|uniref:acyl-CoA synthetase n=1 Tax=Sulfolobaceae TaxID=118883 RepID=UPI000845D7B5|nr:MULTISPECIES: acyl-CoA synthetase [unclassified Sulfolobus]TRM89551.1 AMP-dependent synthetase [Sulfolobus sp. C3]TRM93685.1 AMP-dependent synthetase [Sulfolobus sp. A20-N-G8]TRN00375.1 AMP-dependent synthetase [Sulfolobus sp. E1]AOL16683.1 AMP-dependent synthetase [Sulfolobus sp. A20]TRM96874.1 AMP-dependent synthetase [Sulfolobus sp. B1]